MQLFLNYKFYQEDIKKLKLRDISVENQMWLMIVRRMKLKIEKGGNAPNFSEAFQ